MEPVLLSDNAEVIAAVSAWIQEVTELGRRKASTLAHALLCRKELKVKYGAVNQVLKSINVGDGYDALRDTLEETGLLVPVSGRNGSTVYRIDLSVAGVDADAVRERMAEESAAAEAAAAYEAPQESGEDEDAEPTERIAVEDSGAYDAQDAEDTADEQCADVAGAKVDVPADDAPVDEHPAVQQFEAESTPVAESPEAVQEHPAKRERAERRADTKPGRGQRRDTDNGQSAPQAKERTKSKGKGKAKAAAQDGAKAAAQDGAKADVGAGAKKKNKQKSSKQTANTPVRHEAAVSARNAKRHGVGPLQLFATGPLKAVTSGIARIRHTEPPVPAKAKVQAPQIRFRADRAGDQTEQQRPQSDLDRVAAWVHEHKGEQVPYATRRQRAYQIFDDEKALEGKRGERLMKRMNAKGMNPAVLRISSNQTPSLQGFYGIGSDQPFIVVENIDAYEEIVGLLKGRRHIKLFGARIGGVIFGAGHNVCIAHALDEYLHDIGYTFPFVYYAGDVDREGARLVEKAREVNVIEIRLHTGMYRAMFAAHKAHMERGSASEPAANNQDAPRNLAAILTDLPWSLRVPFKRALRDNIRIPQEVLTSEDFRQGSMTGVERMLVR